MKTIKTSFDSRSPLWTFLFALISGSFITGMTGYVSSGTNYPYVLLAAVTINYILALLISNLSGSGDFSLYQRAVNLFGGMTGQFFSSFMGMMILIVLLIVTTGESKTAAFALRQMLPSDLGLEYYMVVLCTLALVPSLLGVRKNLNFAFYLFIAFIVLRTSFIVYFMMNRTDLPDWSFANIYNPLALSDFTGSNGIIYIGFRLAFWSIIALELLNIWKKNSHKSYRRIALLAVACVILTFTMVPGIYIAGLFPSELWHLIILSEQGCFGDCPSLALGLNFGGQAGMYLMGTSTVLSHVLMVTVCYLMISRVITHLSLRKLFFGALSRHSISTGSEGNNEFVLIFTFLLSLLLSMLNLSASDWVGLSLYLSFGLIMIIQILCLLNATFHWFENRLMDRKSLCVLTALSIAMMAILFYSGFRGEHLRFLNFAFAIFCFSLWVAATSIVYLIKFNKD